LFPPPSRLPTARCGGFSLRGPRVRNYANIITKIVNTPWLITPQALDVILSIMDYRIKNGQLSEEELTIKLLNSNEDMGGGEREGEFTENGIGVLPIYGPIFSRADAMSQMSGATSLETMAADLDEMAANNNVKTIVLDIDSPGGTRDLVKEFGQQIAGVNKPVYAVANSLAGSAAYWIGAQADQFYVTPSGMVGSIGVYSIHEGRSGADASEGRRFTYVSAGPYKTEGNPHEPLSTEAGEYLQSIVNDCYDEFVESVAAGRGVTTEVVRENFGG